MPRRFYTLYEQKFSNLKPILSITFPQKFQKSKKFGHCTSVIGGKKTFKRNEQMKKIRKKLFSPCQFYTLYEQQFSNLRPLLSITFPQGFRISKKLGHWTSGSGGKRPLNGVRKCDGQTDRQTDTRTSRLTESIGLRADALKSPYMGLK